MKVLHTSADGLVVDGKELEFRDRIRVTRPGIIVGVVETRLAKR